jgi:hypothetical protein
MIPAAIPPLDAMPVPAPIWLLKGLLWVTFAIHLVLMNLTLGGSLLSAVYAFKGKERDLDVSRKLAKTLPFTMPFTITLGVAPLLFVQVLYGPLFYASTILMATPFLAVIGDLIVAYYLMYLLGWKGKNLGRLQGYVALVIFLLLGYVGFTFTNVYTLLTSPEHFKALYLADPSGMHFNLADGTVYPRFLHMLLAAVAVTGLYIAYLGQRRLKLEPEVGRWQFKSGVTWFAGATLANFGVGVWWLVSLPREGMLTFMGGSGLATGAFVVGIVAGLAALMLAVLGINSLRPVPKLMGAVHSLTLTIVCMVLMRDALRDSLLKPFYDVWSQPTEPQWIAIALFLVLFVGGVALCVWLLRTAGKAARAKGARGEDVLLGPGLMDSGLHRLSSSDSQALRGGAGPDSPPRPPGS